MSDKKDKLNSMGLRPIRCTRCGRFFGYERIQIGVLKLRCPNCKMFSTIIGESGTGLTEEEEQAIIT